MCAGTSSRRDLALLATACRYDPADLAAFPAFCECEREAATIGIGYNPNTDPPNGSVYKRTEGRDVVVITNGPVTFWAGGGDDLICVDDTGLPWGTDGYGGGVLAPIGTIAIMTGTGADTVHNNVSRDPDNGPAEFDVAVRFGQTSFDAILGDGGDRFFGGPGQEFVELNKAFEGGLPDRGPSRVTTGGGDDYVYFLHGEPELVDCGSETDTVAYQGTWDPDEAIDCERVSCARRKPSLPVSSGRGPAGWAYRRVVGSTRPPPDLQ